MTKWLFCPECKAKLVPGYEDCPSCPDGHFTKYSSPVATATGFIRCKNKFLTVRRNIEPAKGAWDFPGGFLKPNETAVEGLRREIREETGLEVEIIEYLGSFPSVYGDTDEATIGITYLVESSTDAVRLSDENKEFAWHTLDELPQPAFEDCQRALKVLRGKLKT